MPSQIVKVASAVGLHARPASLFVKAVAKSGVEVKIGRPGNANTNAASLLSVLGLGIKFGEEVEIVINEDSDQANELISNLSSIISTNYDH